MQAYTKVGRRFNFAGFRVFIFSYVMYVRIKPDEVKTSRKSDRTAQNMGPGQEEDRTSRYSVCTDIYAAFRTAWQGNEHKTQPHPFIQSTSLLGRAQDRAAHVQKQTRIPFKSRTRRQNTYAQRARATKCTAAAAHVSAVWSRFAAYPRRERAVSWKSGRILMLSGNYGAYQINFQIFAMVYGMAHVWLWLYEGGPISN